MLAGVETVLRHVDILQGAKFKWLTDHKRLIYPLNQKSLSRRQARWLEKISNFTFEVVYITGSDNVVADALSRLYSNNSPGTERAGSEYACADVVDDDTSDVLMVAEVLPVLVGIEARIAMRRGSRVQWPSQRAIMAGLESSRDFTNWMQDHFILKGPQAPAVQKEGRMADGTDTTGSLTGPGDMLEVPADLAAPDAHEGLPTIVDANGPEMDAPGIDTSNALLLGIVSQSTPGLDLLAEFCGKYGLDPTFQSILARPRDFLNFKVDGQLVYLKRPEGRVLCIPKILVQGRSAHEVVILEAHSMLAHLGAGKTLDYL